MKTLASIFTFIAITGTCMFANAQAVSMLSNTTEVVRHDGDEKNQKSHKKETSSDDKSIKKEKKRKESTASNSSSVKKEESDYLFITP